MHRKTIVYSNVIIEDFKFIRRYGRCYADNVISKPKG